VDKNDLCYLTFYEVIKLAQSGQMPISKQELENRKKYSVAVTIKNNYWVFAGKDTYKKFRAAVENKVGKTQEIRGNVAYPGKVRGPVRVVLTGKDIGKVKRGDILVAVMTFPHFVPAMEKAAAFVTDEGGILCHAAIVSREMKKPCVIGTKIATKVLRDGQLVEVDATKGVIKVVK
jgi:pyruvate,water dikinase